MTDSSPMKKNIKKKKKFLTRNKLILGVIALGLIAIISLFILNSQTKKNTMFIGSNRMYDNIPPYTQIKSEPLGDQNIIFTQSFIFEPLYYIFKNEYGFSNTSSNKHLIKQYKNIGNDQYEFELIDDIKFANGKEITAYDIEFSWNVIKKQINNPEIFAKNLYVVNAVINDIVALGNKRFKVRLELGKGQNYLRYAFSNFLLIPNLNKDYRNTNPEIWNNITNPVWVEYKKKLYGSGAFKVYQSGGNNAFYYLDRNDHYRFFSKNCNIQKIKCNFQVNVNRIQSYHYQHIVTGISMYNNKLLKEFGKNSVDSKAFNTKYNYILLMNRKSLTLQQRRKIVKMFNQKRLKKMYLYNSFIGNDGAATKKRPENLKVSIFSNAPDTIRTTDQIFDGVDDVDLPENLSLCYYERNGLDNLEKILVDFDKNSFREVDLRLDKVNRFSQFIQSISVSDLALVELEILNGTEYKYYFSESFVPKDVDEIYTLNRNWMGYNETELSYLLDNYNKNNQNMRKDIHKKIYDLAPAVFLFDYPKKIYFPQKVCKFIKQTDKKNENYKLDIDEIGRQTNVHKLKTEYKINYWEAISNKLF